MQGVSEEERLKEKRKKATGRRRNIQYRKHEGRKRGRESRGGIERRESMWKRQRGRTNGEGD